ncbi:MAG: iron-containing alcohol dehydrogenase [Clostridiales bacterium]|nr:iron-containing alcohol dehydrogenase [Clostridiales bacterium]
MNNFTFSAPTKMIFGKDTEKFVGSEALKYSKKVLVHFGGGSVKKIGVYDKVIKSLKENNIEIFELGGVKPNPRLSLVYEGIDIVKKNDIGLIIAVGGGSVIDSAKAIAVGAKYDGDVWDFYEYTASPKSALPVATVLTIPAAGSESSNSSVITNWDKKLKRGISNDFIIPVFSILNPESTYSLPPYQIACGAADILAHMMERYFVNTKSVDITDRMIEGAIRSHLEFAPKAIKNPTDYDIRAEVMWTGTIAHNGFLDTGRGGDWASHGIEHELSAIYDIAHGAGLAIVFPAWFEFCAKKNPSKIVQFGRRVFDIDSTDEQTIISLTISKLRDFFKELGLALYLDEIDIDETNFKIMAEKAVGKKNGSTIGSYVPLSVSDVVEIYGIASKRS